MGAFEYSNKRTEIASLIVLILIILFFSLVIEIMESSRLLHLIPLILILSIFLFNKKYTLDHYKVRIDKEQTRIVYLKDKSEKTFFNYELYFTYTPAGVSIGSGYQIYDKAKRQHVFTINQNSIKKNTLENYGIEFRKR